MKRINLRLHDKPEDIIWIGRQLNKLFPGNLPGKHWKEWGLKIGRKVARQLKNMALCPDMTNPKHLRHFPSKMSTMIDLFQLFNKRPEAFRAAIANDTINQDVRRGDIRDLKAFGKTVGELRNDRRQAAWGNPTFVRDGHGIYSGTYEQLHDLVEDNSVTMMFVDAPWAEQASLIGGVATLAAKKLKPGGWLLALCGHDSVFDVIEVLTEHLTPNAIFGLLHNNRKPRYARNLSNFLQPLLVFNKPPVPSRFPCRVADYIKAHKDKTHHEWGLSVEDATYYVEKFTKPGDLIADPFCGGGTLPVVCQLLSRRCIATEIRQKIAAAARARVAALPKN